MELEKTGRKLWRQLHNQSGMVLVEYLVLFGILFPLAMALVEAGMWAGEQMQITAIVNNTAPYLGYVGGANEAMVESIRQRLVDGGFDPSDITLHITYGPVPTGKQGVIELTTHRSFRMLTAIGIDVTIPMGASATFVSHVPFR